MLLRRDDHVDAQAPDRDERKRVELGQDAPSRWRRQLDRDVHRRGLVRERGARLQRDGDERRAGEQDRDARRSVHHGRSILRSPRCALRLDCRASTSTSAPIAAAIGIGPTGVPGARRCSCPLSPSRSSCRTARHRRRARMADRELRLPRPRSMKRPLRRPRLRRRRRPSPTLHRALSLRRLRRHPARRCPRRSPAQGEETTATGPRPP